MAGRPTTPARIAELAEVSKGLITHNLRGPDGGRRLSMADHEETHRAQQDLVARGLGGMEARGPGGRQPSP